MDRRDVIKSLSAGLGYSLTPGVIASLITSCKDAEQQLSWTPKFFDLQDAFFIEELGETFLPKTQTPGAKDVGAHLFVDIFLKRAAKSKDREICSSGLEALKNSFERITGTAISSAQPADYPKLLEHYYNVDEAQGNEINELIGGDEPTEATEKERFRVYSFLKLFKKLIMMGYYASEEVGEHVLSYLPVPGEYESCIPVESVGNAWSL